MTEHSLEDRVRNALYELLPAMTADGGGAELVVVQGTTVTVRLIGSCLFCPSRSLSAAALERGLRDRVPDIVAVNVLYPPGKRAVAFLG